jgi:predicted transcriptional regulator
MHRFGKLERWVETLEEMKCESAALWRRARKELGMTQRQLAGKLEISNIWISKIESGDGHPSHDMQARLLELLREDLE